MSASNALRTRAARYDARADRLQTIAAMFAGRAARLRANGLDRAAEALEAKVAKAERVEQRCLFFAMGCRLAAARIEQHEAQARALMSVAA